MTESSEIQTNTYLTFYLDQELYGLNIQNVQEVLEYTSITKVPRTAHFMRGVVNVRGHALPVVDLRRKFELPEAEENVDTSIVITEVDIDGETTAIGALVDGVEEVLEIPPEQIEDPPKLGSHIASRFIRGIGKLEERFVILLDIQQVFSMQELTQIGSSAREAGQTEAEASS
jgi:purine-binding chemotaxis protein CheW